MVRTVVTCVKPDFTRAFSSAGLKHLHSRCSTTYIVDACNHFGPHAATNAIVEVNTSTLTLPALCYKAFWWFCVTHCTLSCCNAFLCVLHRNRTQGCSGIAILFGAKNGQLTVLQWMLEVEFIG
eukprot:10844-Heterococcus_DN1.PRE.3